jgi:hypothetical protein
MNVADSFLKSIHKKNKYIQFIKWRKQFGPYFFTNKVRDYIIPFLKQNKYELLVDEEIFTKRFMTWIWAYYYVGQGKSVVSLGEASHQGTEDDYDWYCLNIGDKWDALFDQIQTYNFFDESYLGQKHRLNFEWFIWLQLDLNNSKYYIRTNLIRENYQDEEDDKDIDRERERITHSNDLN